MNEPLEKFEPRMVAGAGADIFVRIGGDGPPLLLLHGYPQTHVMWHRLAPVLARHFRLVIADLRGYGRSSMPQNDRDNRVYSKRAMAADMVAVMTALGHERFAVAGHDRGGRVGYRMALDAPAVVERLAVLDIIPTYDMWTGMDGKLAVKVYHWPFLAQAPPMPERLIESDTRFYLDWTLGELDQERRSRLLRRGGACRLSYRLRCTGPRSCRLQRLSRRRDLRSRRRP